MLVSFSRLFHTEFRSRYDSLDTSTDALPTAEEVQAGGFFPVMRHHFEMNARWSIDKRIPSLGDESTRMSEVESFYHFWESFKSWRDFRCFLCGCLRGWGGGGLSVCVCVYVKES